MAEGNDLVTDALWALVFGLSSHRCCSSVEPFSASFLLRSILELSRGLEDFPWGVVCVCETQCVCSIPGIPPAMRYCRCPFSVCVVHLNEQRGFGWLHNCCCRLGDRTYCRVRPGLPERIPPKKEDIWRQQCFSFYPELRCVQISRIIFNIAQGTRILITIYSWFKL